MPKEQGYISDKGIAMSIFGHENRKAFVSFERQGLEKHKLPK